MSCASCRYLHNQILVGIARSCTRTGYAGPSSPSSGSVGAVMMATRRRSPITPRPESIVNMVWSLSEVHREQHQTHAYASQNEQDPCVQHCALTAAVQLDGFPLHSRNGTELLRIQLIDHELNTQPAGHHQRTVIVDDPFQFLSVWVHWRKVNKIPTCCTMRQAHRRTPVDGRSYRPSLTSRSTLKVKSVKRRRVPSMG